MWYNGKQPMSKTLSIVEGPDSGDRMPDSECRTVGDWMTGTDVRVCGRMGVWEREGIAD